MSQPVDRVLNNDSLTRYNVNKRLPDKYSFSKLLGETEDIQSTLVSGIYSVPLTSRQCYI